MVFSSVTFLCVFLPVVFALYCVIPGLKAKNILLIAASLVFYAYGEPVYVLLLLASAVYNYFFARVIGASEKAGVKKTALALAVAVNVGVLGVFKYAGFAVGSLNSVTGLSLRVPEIALPIGISFFTFQALSYVIDVYRGQTPYEKNFLNILLYISFFPQLIAGPIVKFHDVNEALSHRTQTLDGVRTGLRRFICGLGKKVLIANVMGQTADAAFGADPGELSSPLAWLGAACYMLQIYYDFSGYSDMAIGLGRMFGFRFKENFNYPYTALSAQDFWRRWHISMSTWFKEYLYIPLGGNRKGKARTALNKIIVFFCTGLWHGANWTFVVWGLYHGFFLLLENYVPFPKKLPKALGRLYAWAVVCIGFVFFRSDSIGAGAAYIAGMFTGFSSGSAGTALLMKQLTPWFLFIFVLAVLGSAFLEKPVARLRAMAYGQVSGKAAAAVRVALDVLSLALLVWCLMRLSTQGYNPFIYFQF
ncbi:MAG: MBOAT family protein [Clostridia bacterium]|nr:MBOAT family protein [Clostridia bacterium]